MARKAIKGYAEKNYYDNTKFSGGIVATNDPLNEGYFKHLVNFDISDMGQSLTPRKGYLTTSIKSGDELLSLSKNTIYFYDISLGKYIFFETVYKKAWIVDFNITEGFISDATVIPNIDVSDLDTVIHRTSDYSWSIMPLTSNQALSITEDTLVTSYIIKVNITYNDIEGVSQTKDLWLKLFYRENESEFEGNIYEAKTLVVSYLDTENIVETTDTTLRNIASHASVIPNPMQMIYPKDSIDIPHINQLPMIYIKQDDKYLYNEVKASVEGISIIPNFYVTNTYNDYEWAYTYDIISTNKDYTISRTDNKSPVYKAPINYLKDNVRSDISTNLYTDSITGNRSASRYLLNLGVSDTDQQESMGIDQYTEYINCRCATDNTMDTSYVLYVVPTRSDVESYPMDITREDLLGPLGLCTYLSHTQVLFDESGTDDDITAIEEAHNEHISKYGTIFSYQYCAHVNVNDVRMNTNINSLAAFLNSLKNLSVTDDGIYHSTKYVDLNIYIEEYPGIDYFSNNEGGYQECSQTMNFSSILSWNRKPLTPLEILNNSELLKKLSMSSCVKIIFLDNLAKVQVQGNVEHVKEYKRLLPNMSPNSDMHTYYMSYTQLGGQQLFVNEQDFNVNKPTYTGPLEYFYKATTEYNKYKSIFFVDKYGKYSSMPLVNTTYGGLSEYLILNWYEEFFNINNGILSAQLNSNNELYVNLADAGFFNTGLIINFYLLHIPHRDRIEDIDILSRTDLINSTSLKVSRQLTIVPNTNAHISTYVEYLTEEPDLIANADKSLVYNSLLGNHLVLYSGNKVFISKENQHYYFISDYMREFPEPVVKVLQYKEILLVFTTLNLYAIYLYEDTIAVQNGTDSEGNVQYAQQTVYHFASLPVLYNIMVNEKYKDAIQIYNQMVLFYSADGQMFLIKPTAAIDSNTRFSIQYFNKSANDILLNYKDYMQQRLEVYGITDAFITDVEIKVIADINHIKIFYTAPGIMTYILIYDVLNNRYYTYDTISFNKINSIQHTTLGELYITEQGDNLYFTTSYANINEVDSNVDTTYYDYFDTKAILTEIDTGVLNLNNHLKKRFKDLHVIYKNLDANQLEFTLSTYVDDIPIVTYVDSTFEVRNVASFDTLVVRDTTNVVQLIEQTALFNFSDYSSNKVITHKSNIISRGKTIRAKMNFSSKGKYKIQGYGLVYKEHSI